MFIEASSPQVACTPQVKIRPKDGSSDQEVSGSRHNSKGNGAKLFYIPLFPGGQITRGLQDDIDFGQTKQIYSYPKMLTEHS